MKTNSWFAVALMTAGGLMLATLLLPGRAFSAPQEKESGAAQKSGDQKEEPKKQAGDAAKGKVVFGENCALCHDPESNDALVGPGLKGLFSWPPHQLSDGTKRDKETEESVRKQITEGGGAMQAVGADFSEEQLSNLIAYLKTL
jgi:cytochrome c